MRQTLVRYLLRFDGLAGLVAGLNTFLTITWLANLYGLPAKVLMFNGMANLLYGTFSTTLATLPNRPLYLIKTLSVANCMWAVLCFAFAFNLPSTATVFAAGHAVFEGLFVGSLGVLEWCFRHQLRLKLPASDFTSQEKFMAGPSRIDLSGSTNDVARWIWKNLVPKRGHSEYVQGEVLRAIEKLRFEAQENGNINWNEFFVEQIDFIERVLTSEPCFEQSTKDQIHSDLHRLRHFLTPNQLTSRSQVSDLPYIDDDLYDRLVERLVDYCRLHPELISYRPEPQ